MARPLHQGVGLALRWAFIDDLLDGAGAELPFVEITPETYIGRGGHIAEALTEVIDAIAVSTHGLALNVGSVDPLDRHYLRALRGFLDRAGVETHSDHLCWNGAGGRHLHELLPLPADPEVARRTAARVRRVQESLGRRVALENISYYALPYATMPEHEFLATVLDLADCGLLLDVNNVWVNAQNHGFDAHAYLRSLPLERVERIHVAGGERSARHGGLVIDTHGTAVDVEVRELMMWVLERVGPVPVTYERDQSIPPLCDLLAEVRVLQTAYDEAVERYDRQVYPARPPASKERRGPAAIELSLVQSRITAAILAPEVSSASRDSTRVPGLDVYRGLVRDALLQVAEHLLPRTRVMCGTGSFEREFSTWLAQQGPESPFLRDTAREFAAWLVRRWTVDPNVAPVLAELADHELVELEVSMACAWPGPRDQTKLDLDDVVEFDPTVRTRRYHHRVHEPVAHPAEIAPATVRLLGYRDDDHEVRWLELSKLSYEVVVRLATGIQLGEAVRAAAAACDGISDAILGRVAWLLADLVDRGVIRGAVRPSSPAVASAAT